MYQAPNGSHQPPSQHGYSHSYSGPPPAKRPKGNPVITRYPPPPGYKGPAQPQPAFQQQPSQQYQQPQPWQPPAPAPSYGYGQPGFQQYPQQPYPQQPYSAPVSHYPPQWQGHQQPPVAPSPYGPPQGYYPPLPPNAQAHQQSWQPPAPAPQSAPPQAWHPPRSFPPANIRHNSAPFPHTKIPSIALVDGNGDAFSPEDSTGDEGDLEEDFPYDYECYYARHPEEIVPELSLGMIQYHPALPTRIALPSTFQEAELEAVAPRNPRPQDEESISDYFTNDKREETLLSVRQTAIWDEIKNDLIFKEFPRHGHKTLSADEVNERYLDRPDPTWTASPTPDGSRQPTPVMSEQPPTSRREQSSDDVHGGWRQDSSQYVKEESTEESDVLGNLEQALLSTGPTNGHTYRANSFNGSSHSRNGSITSQSGQRITRPTALAPVRDRAQEDLLASLGVTGAPKMVYQTPGPAFAPQPDYRDGSRSRQNSFTNGNTIHNDSRRPPPPPPPPMHQHPSVMHANGWHDQDRRNGYPTDRPGSATSQHTAAGSDFHSDDMEVTPRQTTYDDNNRSEGRKRSRSELERLDNDKYHRVWHGDVDSTPKPKRKQQRVDDAYSRRW